MLKVAHEVYYLDYLELKILAAKIGAEEIYGFSFASEENISKEAVIETLYKMAKKDILAYRDDQLIIRDEYNDIITHLVETKRISVLLSKDFGCITKCIYWGEKILVSETSEERRNRIKFYFIEKEDLAEWLDTSGYLEKYVPIQALDESIEGKSFPQNADEVLQLEECLWVMKWIDTESRTEIGWISLMEEKLLLKLAFCKRNQISEKIYSFENLEAMIREIF